MFDYSCDYKNKYLLIVNEVLFIITNGIEYWLQVIRFIVIDYTKGNA